MSSFTLSPARIDPDPATQRVVQLIGVGTNWTPYTMFSIELNGVSLQASQIDVQSATRATWSLVLASGDSGDVTVSDGSSSVSLFVRLQIILGDLPAAIVERLRADPDIAALAGDRISMAFPEGRRQWPMPTYAIIVRPSGGLPPMSEDERRFARVDIHCYGAGASPNVRRRTARLLWRTMEPVLCPPPSLGIPTSFQAAGVIVYKILPQQSEPATVPEPNTDWDRAVMSYIVEHARLPAG